MTQEQLIAVLVANYRWSEEAVLLGIRAGFRCEYCDRDLLASVDDYDAWNRDHIFPSSKGGSDTDIDNLAVACKTCNYMKRHWMPAHGDSEGLTRAARIKSVREFLRSKRDVKEAQIREMRDLVAAFHQASGIPA